MSINERAGHVFGGLCIAVVGIVVMLTWWQLIEAQTLRNRSANQQRAYYEQRIKRGVVSAAGGQVLARSQPSSTRNGDQIWRRTYPRKQLAAHVVGYYTLGKSKTGIEKSFNDYLTGSTRSLGTLFDKLDGSDLVVGDNVELTIDAGAQRVAQRSLTAAGKRGAVVALDPATGKVLVMASNPSYDLNDVDRKNFSSIASNPDAPLVNRATQGRYPPGSTFKVITTAAALESGEASPDEKFRGGCKYETAGPPIYNFAHSCVGPHDLPFALTNSINISFAELGDRVGRAGLYDQMEAFGFGTTKLLDDLPAEEQRASGIYGSDGKLLEEDQPIDAARVGIGQERLQVTPLQMALVAGGIGNGGVVMKPFLVNTITKPDSTDVVYRAKPDKLSKAMSASTASELTDMMTNVVKQGTGVAAARPDMEVAGKTGTADTGSGNQTWFIAFAPADNPEVAIAVTVEGLPAGSTGGLIAAPIARDVMDALL